MNAKRHLPKKVALVVRQGQDLAMVAASCFILFLSSDGRGGCNFLGQAFFFFFSSDRLSSSQVSMIIFTSTFVFGTAIMVHINAWSGFVNE